MWTPSWSSPTPRRPPRSCAPASWRSSPPGWPPIRRTGTCAASPRWSTRRRSPRSTPCAPRSSGSRAICWTCIRTSACWTRARRACSCWTPSQRCWSGAMRRWRRGTTSPSWWTPCRRGGMTAAWSRSCWTSGGGSRAIPARRRGWRSRSVPSCWTACPRPARRYGAGCCWRTPGGRPTTGPGRWPGPWSCAFATMCLRGITPPACPPRWRGCAAFPRPPARGGTPPGRRFPSPSPRRGGRRSRRGWPTPSG